ncbi:putative tRNA(Met) cytidine acetyltransferase [Helianthus annuus]|uniref:RNA cytidine acetyltransferase n=1 Tax=Helianthus annuus TaxID=4232 RepID=A0A251RZ99_HELAN|nr:RNA cytidine acetyltransferase 1 [Helianthus annuus]KAF5799022.1 putative tRNA(Met) cytidine acetyltransferase [Helianthus annuus]KAJ0563493.1 putative tRNA(Met) cytidine acetyltransferase [Helianthus annuus]KAJ0728831.1 putative tRNA(Met) cytidine acetyltransferase [Helianthus annuus]KAJ0731589.1 putative tRNA(Met) cytidine acetyltransferase [Helianthus annuus]KAJ0905114.1 putative tRNA(Met) cytidine acetyltransferase [Helianthus annuus]
MRKKVDERIRTLIENGVKTRHRSIFVIIGDKSRDQIVNLHYMLSKSVVKSRPNVLWCYRDKLELSSHKKKRAKQVKKLMHRGLLDPEKVDPFSLFLETAGITYCQYKDSERILGNTFGMCILQDFEALTPNLLARTIETVEGGGLIILLLRSLTSLTSLYTMVMDVHERFRTESHSLATGRFNERFLLSLASCGSCIVMDDELNILPISSHMKSITPVPVEEDSEGLSEAQRDLKDLKEQLKDDFPVGPLIKKCCTLDQGKAVITFLDAILDKTLRSTVALLSGRGRGKSAALGLAVAGAVAAGYSNIFVTAPSPENLKTLFEFVSKGFDMLEYKEHLDYDIVKSSNPELKKATIRINIYKQHRQTIQYILPHEHGKLSQVELLVIDEAAAIPLPVVKSLLGPYLVFLSSTVNGYEGTGRSLSLKLLQQLEEQSTASTKSTDAVPSGRLFRKIELSEAIRYASGDPVESWLNNLLCLDIAKSIPSINRLPPPSECDLYYVNRDTLFSYHKDSELFLQRMMALYVASHYKNSPNDLQLLADAPAHHLFVLLGPVNESRNQLPDILCVIQVCLEGKISKASAMRSLSAGHQPSGDQIPWKFCEQFQDKDFPSLSGARIVRIATHPNAMKLGYGSAAIELLARYFEGQFTPISEVDVENDPEPSSPVKITEAAEKVSLLEENIKPKTDLPPLLVHLSERRPEKLHYLGVSFGLTLDLFRFWRKHKFAPFYLCEIPNSVTGEHTCMMLKPLDTDDIEVRGSDELGFFGPFYQAFRSSFARLLCSPRFNTMEYKLAMSILDPKLSFTDVEPSSTISHSIYDDIIKSPISMKRLEAYVNHLVDYHLISDLKLPLAYLYFQEKLPVALSYAQASVLLCMGLQNQDASYAEGMMKLERQQIMSLFMKVMKKFHKYLDSVSTKEFNSTLPPVKEVELKPHEISVDEDLDEAAKKVKDDFKANSEGLLNPEFLQRYAIADKDVDFESALQNGGGKVPSGGVISVKSSKTKPEKHGKTKGDKSDKKRSKDGSSSKSSKKRRT